MKINEQWLRHFADPPVDYRQLAEQLTMAGLEVEGIEQIRCDIKGVVVARVDSVEKHPDKKGLSLCRVNDGSDQPLTIVCAAPNVQEDHLYPLARIGAILPGNIKINARDFDGIQSQGMLCSEAELGLAEVSSGLMNLPNDLEPGTDLAALLQTEDRILDISLTPNRGDCLSVLGIAREVSVINNCSLKLIDPPKIDIGSKASREVVLDNPVACPRYCGRVIENVDVSRATPLWMIERLTRCGLRSINAVVDITNYVMLESGQPMHAFDNDKLMGNIVVRQARKGEKLTLLEGGERELTPETLVIADEEKVLAMAGIMGGEESAVSQATRNIFLESAYFNPGSISGQARKFGLHTDSSHRFERGVDYELSVAASQRATGLILEICGGDPGPQVEMTENVQLPLTQPVILRHDRLQSVLGITIPAEKVTDIFNKLGMEVTAEDGKWKIIPPTYRYDIEIEADLIEEVARIYGYDSLPEKSLKSSLSFVRQPDRERQLRELGQYFIYRGYYETITYSFVEEKLQALITPDIEPVRLVNPIASEMAVMRTSLIPGLLQALLYNWNRQQHRIRLFESGQVFLTSDDAGQIPRLGGVVTGNLFEKQWDTNDIPSDFFAVKADIVGLACRLGLQDRIKFISKPHSALHPGQSSEIMFENQYIGYLGRLHPMVQKQLELPQPVIIFELEVSNISLHNPVIYQKLSKYPVINRDISIVVDNSVLLGDIVNCIGNTAPNLLKNLQLFDVYQGEPIDIGKKSLALGLTFQGYSSTLTDQEIDRIIETIINRLNDEFGATLRE